jgi:hypothetical protein
MGPGINPSLVTNQVLVYLNSNITVQGTFIDFQTVEFPAGWLESPPNLPSTSIIDFSFFINGVLIDNADITSFTQNNGVSTLIINPSTLGYSLSSTDVITSIGKFNS